MLPADAPVGTPLADVLGDTIFELSVTPNRADWLSVLGVAREVAALTGETVREPSLEYAQDGAPIKGRCAVEIEAPDLCRRYVATVIEGVKIGPSPEWMQERLIALGQRPINNVVDITNYVMLEIGQPLHAFDYDQRRRPPDHRAARRATAKSSRRSTASERELTDDMLVIADERGPVALAGVMGGLESEVTDKTDEHPAGGGDLHRLERPAHGRGAEGAQRGVVAVREGAAAGAGDGRLEARDEAARRDLRRHGAARARSTCIPAKAARDARRGDARAHRAGARHRPADVEGAAAC